MFLKADETIISLFFNYINFADVFSKILATKLLKYIEINNHTIDLVEGQKLSYESFYNLRILELEIIKAFIKTNLTISFIRLFKSFVGTFILFVKKADSKSLVMC